MSGTYSNLIFHVVFCTKQRKPFIGAALEKELYKCIMGVIQGEDALLLKAGGTENHVHLVLSLSPSHNIPNLLQRIKGHSSKWINGHHKTEGRFSWQKGYGIFSVSASQLAIVTTYVGNQKEHHRQRTFEDEFVQLLKKNNIEYDPRYLWD